MWVARLPYLVETRPLRTFHPPLKTPQIRSSCCTHSSHLPPLFLLIFPLPSLSSLLTRPSSQKQSRRFAGSHRFERGGSLRQLPPRVVVCCGELGIISSTFPPQQRHACPNNINIRPFPALPLQSLFRFPLSPSPSLPDRPSYLALTTARTCTHPHPLSHHNPYIFSLSVTLPSSYTLNPSRQQVSIFFPHK